MNVDYKIKSYKKTLKDLHQHIEFKMKSTTERDEINELKTLRKNLLILIADVNKEFT